jgi:hypothetical protein
MAGGFNVICEGVYGSATLDSGDQSGPPISGVELSTIIDGFIHVNPGYGSKSISY